MFAAALSAAPFVFAAAALAGPDDPPSKDRLLRAMPDLGSALTRVQIKSCMKLAIEIHEHAKSLEEPERAFDQQRRELQNKGDALKKAKQTVDPRSKKAVAEFNRRLAELEAEQEAFNDAVDRLNADHLRKSAPAVQHYNVDCAGRSYTVLDEGTVIKELGLKENPMKGIKSKFSPDPSLLKPSDLRPRPPASGPGEPGALRLDVGPAPQQKTK